MNYFQYYDIPETLHLDLKLLRDLYYQKSRELHPDLQKQQNTSTDELQEKAAQNNQAYKTLSDPLLRLKHALELNIGALQENQQSLPADFLMQMMDLHEKISEAIHVENIQTRENLQNEIEEIQNKIHIIAKPFINSFDQNDRSSSLFEGLLDYYYKLKYIRRLHQNLNREEFEL
ncbi:MAG: Fe-S protein assembly co-chaperone HscB [Bacteroidota bacterium]|nr:Fe-S protein assembly co-chaperone HscB [Bacteroidota bacterium]